MTVSLLLGDRIDQYTFTCQKLLLIGTTVDTVTVLTLIRALTIILNQMVFLITNQSLNMTVNNDIYLVTYLQKSPFISNIHNNGIKDPDRSVGFRAIAGELHIIKITIAECVNIDLLSRQRISRETPLLVNFSQVVTLADPAVSVNSTYRLSVSESGGGCLL